MIHFTRDRQVDLGEFLDSPSAFSEWLNARTAEAMADLEQQAHARLDTLDAGWSLCVHGPEMRRDGEEWGATGPMTVRWQCQAHLLPPGGVCTFPGTGGRLQLGPKS